LSKGLEGSIDTKSTESYFVLNKLTNNQEYTINVVALSGETESARSNSIKVTPIIGGVSAIEILGDPSAVPSSDSVTITWNTTLSGTSVVEYGPTSDFKGEISSGVEKTRRHSITISSLTPCAGYWYKVVSYDENSNLAESQGGEFKTTGCKGDSNIVTYEVAKVTRETGATVTVTNDRGSINVSAPANLKSSLDAVAIEALKLEKELVKTEVSTPNSKQWIGNAYSLKAFQDEKSEVSGNFDSPVEVTISYVDEDVSGIDLSTLNIYHYEDGTGWRPLNNCVVNTSSKEVTCETSSFSIFGLFGSEQVSGGSAPQEESVSSGTQSSGYTPIKTVTSEKPQPSTQTETITEKTKFDKNLSYGERNPDVKKLQVFLNSAGFAVSQSGAGSSGFETEFFGPLTYKALVKFQEFYQKEILAPFGLTKGTGFFGEKTRELINSL
jgi:hypothetical protein